MARGLLCVAVSLLVGTAVYGQITAPIPLLSEEPGYRFNPDSEGAPVRLEAFIELLCSDSAYSYPILQEVQDYYGAANLDLVFKIQTLPYHRQAWLTTQGVHQVEAKAPEALFDYFQIILDNIGQLSGGATVELSEVQVSELIGTIQEPATGIPADEFASSIGQYGSAAIREWKYASRRGIAGTPWFVVNNVDLAVNPSIRLSFDDWRAILDPLVPTGYRRTDATSASEAAIHKVLSPHILRPKQEALERKQKAKNMVAAKLKDALNVNKNQ